MVKFVLAVAVAVSMFAVDTRAQDDVVFEDAVHAWLKDASVVGNDGEKRAKQFEVYENPDIDGRAFAVTCSVRERDAWRKRAFYVYLSVLGNVHVEPVDGWTFGNKNYKNEFPSVFELQKPSASTPRAISQKWLSQRAPVDYPSTKAKNRMPSNSEAQVAVRMFYHQYAHNPSSVKYRNWRYKAINVEGSPMKLIRVFVFADNAFGGKTGWQDKEFGATCLLDKRCAALEVEYGLLWNTF